MKKIRPPEEIKSKNNFAEAIKISGTVRVKKRVLRPGKRKKFMIKEPVKIKHFLYWYAIVVATVVIDQLTKWLTVRYMKDLSIPIFQDILHLTYVENRGAAFGILDSQRWIYMLISSVAILVLSYLLYRFSLQSKMFCISLAMVIGGGIGNMIDRIFRGFVVDMIDFRIINFAVFNAADTFICVGAALLAVYIIFFDKTLLRENRTPKKDDASAEKSTVPDAAHAEVPCNHTPSNAQRYPDTADGKDAGKSGSSEGSKTNCTEKNIEASDENGAT